MKHNWPPSILMYINFVWVVISLVSRQRGGAEGVSAPLESRRKHVLPLEHGG